MFWILKRNPFCILFLVALDTQDIIPNKLSIIHIGIHYVLDSKEEPLLYFIPYSARCVSIFGLLH